ncbi:hypothetical protein JCM2811A_02410 [Methylorubrum rhodinum]
MANVASAPLTIARNKPAPTPNCNAIRQDFPCDPVPLDRDLRMVSRGAVPARAFEDGAHVAPGCGYSMGPVAPALL